MLLVDLNLVTSFSALNMAHSSIGNMTNTLIETGSRHMQQCRTNFDVLKAMAGSEEDLLNNDDQWCMAKDELVVSCNKHMNPNAPKTGTKYAYPSVVTTLGVTSIEEKVMLASHYHFMGHMEGKALQEASFTLAGGKPLTPSEKSNQFREFIPVGYSVGRACAHGYKGDTVASVQIGGLRTVLNGAFSVQTGDMMQMYIPEAEAGMFDEKGGRVFCESPIKARELIEASANKDQSDGEKKRMLFYTRGQGPGPSGTRTKNGMFSLKPYMETANDFQLQYYGDKIRVFARAVSSARPYEPVDIMISRQSL